MHNAMKAVQSLKKIEYGEHKNSRLIALIKADLLEGLRKPGGGLLLFQKKIRKKEDFTMHFYVPLLIRSLLLQLL